MSEYVVTSVLTGAVVHTCRWSQDATAAAKKLAIAEPGARFRIYKLDHELWSKVIVQDSLPKAGPAPSGAASGEGE